MCGEGEGKMRRLLKFKEENLKGLHFFTENLEFPVVAASYNECDKQRLYCLERNFRSVDCDYTTENICQWCISNNVEFQIIYPCGIKNIMTAPCRYLAYLRLKRKLDKTCN